MRSRRAWKAGGGPPAHLRTSQPSTQLAVMPLLVALLAMLLVVAPGSGTAHADVKPCDGQYSGTSPTSGLVKQAHPVVLVHGWTGGPMQETRTALESRMKTGWQFLLFDYHQVSDHWAARPEIAKTLAKYIQCVSDAHHAAGGDGHVFVVAHSMGGLATLYAANPTNGGPDMGSRLGGLVTLDTPWTGTSWGGKAEAYLAQSRAMMHFPSPTSDAWTCLGKTVGGTGTCSTPSFLPPPVPVAQIAGQVTISRTFFGIHAYDMPTAGDLVVTTDSQQSYRRVAAGTPWGQHQFMQTVSCTTDLSAVLAEKGTKYGSRFGWAGALIGGLTAADLQMLADGHIMDALSQDKVDESVLEVVGFALFRAPCSHVGMPNDPPAMDAVAAQLQQEAAANRLEPTQLYNAPIPPSCTHPAAQLEDKKRDWYQAGGAELTGPTVTVPNLRGDGQPTLMSAIACTAGGVGWPQLLLAYGEGPTLLSWVDLADVTPAEHATITAMAPSSTSAVHVEWGTTEGCCSNAKTFSGVLRWRDGKLAMTQVQQLSGQTAECSEDALRTAIADDASKPLLQLDTGSGPGSFFYDTFDIHGCAGGYALIEASHSSGSSFSFMAMNWDGGHWRIAATAGTRRDTPVSQPLFDRNQLDIALNGHLAEFLQSVGSRTKDGRAITP